MIDHSVYLNVLKNEMPFLANREIYSGDWLDAGFNDWYPDHQWVSERSIVFYRDQFRGDLPNDIVTVTNGTATKIAYLKVLSVDIVITFDLDPLSSTTCTVSRSRGDSKWTSFEGEFANGKPIAGSSLDFDVRKRSGPVSYQIRISENEATITGH